MEKFNLCGEWKLFDENGNEYKATVPGCVHTDIIKTDMFWRDNIQRLLDIENKDWEYQKTFSVDSIKDNAYLLFEGLDVYCDIYLNDQKIAYCDNMFIPHKINVDGYACCHKKDCDKG